MNNQTCGECKFNGVDCRCEANEKACNEFEPKLITNGDKIRQMSNEDMAERFGIRAICDLCPAETASCQHGQAIIKHCKQNWLNYLNAPAESEVEDE